MLSRLRQVQEELQRQVNLVAVEASAGGGMVSVKMNGQKQVLQTRIDPAAVQGGDVEMLQDLVTAAVNEAGRKIDSAMQSTVGGMLGGLGLPGM